MKTVPQTNDQANRERANRIARAAVDANQEPVVAKERLATKAQKTIRRVQNRPTMTSVVTQNPITIRNATRLNNIVTRQVFASKTRTNGTRINLFVNKLMT